MHSLFKMFHMSIHALLDKQPSGELARSHLHSFITDYLSGEPLVCFLGIYEFMCFLGKYEFMYFLDMYEFMVDAYFALSCL